MPKLIVIYVDLPVFLPKIGYFDHGNIKRASLKWVNSIKILDEANLLKNSGDLEQIELLPSLYNLSNAKSVPPIKLLSHERYQIFDQVLLANS